MKRSRKRMAAFTPAFTLIELLVVVTIIVLLVALLIPALGRAKQLASTSVCLANLKGIGNAISIYENDNNDFILPGYTRTTDFSTEENWASLLVGNKYIIQPDNGAMAGASANGPDTGLKTIFRCPNGLPTNWGQAPNAFAGPATQQDDQGARFWRKYSAAAGRMVDTWYAVNCLGFSVGAGNATAQLAPFQFHISDDPTQDQSLQKIININKPADVAMIFDGLWLCAQYHALINARHNNGTITNVLLADGHAESLLTFRLPQADGFGIAGTGGYPRWTATLP